MSCVKHKEQIVSFCQSCTVFICKKCPIHKYHITIDYTLYINQCKAEVQAFAKSAQAKEKMLEMLEARIQGYIEAIDLNKKACLDGLKSATEELHKVLDTKSQELHEEVEQLTTQYLKPLESHIERIKGYMMDIHSMLSSSENLITKLASEEGLDPVIIAHDMRKLNISESHYIDTFIRTCRNSLESKVPLIPVVEKDLTVMQGGIVLNYKSKQLEIKPLFPYWNLDRLLSTLKLKDQGSSIISKTDNWATAIFKESFSSGKATAEFLISKDGSGSKLYIGVISSNTPGLNLCKAFNSTSGYTLWSYRICGEMHSKGIVYDNLKDKRRFRRGDKIKIDLDMERMIATFYKNSEEIYTFIDISESVIPFVCFGESFQSVQVISCETTDPKVIFH